MYKRSKIQSPPTPKTDWCLVSWSDDKELSSGANAISWYSLIKKYIYIKWSLFAQTLEYGLKYHAKSNLTVEKYPLKLNEKLIVIGSQKKVIII